MLNLNLSESLSEPSLCRRTGGFYFLRKKIRKISEKTSNLMVPNSALFFPHIRNIFGDRKKIEYMKS